MKNIFYGTFTGHHGNGKDSFWRVLFVTCSMEGKSQNNKRRNSRMGQSIEYQKLMTEMVYVNLPGPEEAAPGMTGGELLHGFLAELYRTSNPDVKNYVNLLCSKWNVRYREMRG